MFVNVGIMLVIKEDNMKKEYRILIIPIITLASYLFCDDPNPDPEFMKLSFVGRMKWYYKQIDYEDFSEVEKYEKEKQKTKIKNTKLANIITKLKVNTGNPVRDNDYNSVIDDVLDLELEEE